MVSIRNLLDSLLHGTDSDQWDANGSRPDGTVTISRGRRVAEMAPTTGRRITTVGRYKRFKDIREFSLPSPAEQAEVHDILQVLKQVLLPAISESDIQLLDEVLDSVDQVLYQGLEDSGNWVLPRTFTQIPFVQKCLVEGNDPDIVIAALLDGLRTLIWLYRDDLEGYIPAILELEEAFQYITGRQIRKPDIPSQPLSSEDSLPDQGN